MKYLLFISSVFLLWGCASPYKDLHLSDGDINAIQKFKPDFHTALYTATVDVVGKHLSGLLLIKTMNDKSTRIDFSSEMGLKFFDFEFDSVGTFNVHYVLDKMNRKPVLTTLRKDFELVLMQHLDLNKGKIKTDDKFNYYIFPSENEFRYYITDPSGQKLERIESGTERKPKVQAYMFDYMNGVPDSISILHKNFNFTISLKRLIR